MGCHQLTGDDVCETIRPFGDSIFLVHARDVQRRPGDLYQDGRFDEPVFGRARVTSQESSDNGIGHHMPYVVEFLNLGDGPNDAMAQALARLRRLFAS